MLKSNLEPYPLSDSSLFWLKVLDGWVAENKENSIHFNFFQRFRVNLKIILGLATMQAIKQLNHEY